MLVAHDVNPILRYLDRVVYVAGADAVCGTPDEVITSETLTRLYRTPIEVLQAHRRPAGRSSAQPERAVPCSGHRARP